MTENTELTIREFLSGCAPEAQSVDETLDVRMCEMLAGSLGNTNCEGGWEAVRQLCDITTSETYTKHQLDWAYQQLTGMRGSC